jgi:hypothetical protein
MEFIDARHLGACTCPACTGLQTDNRGEGPVVVNLSLDPQAGGSYAGKPIFTVDEINANLNRTGWDWYTNNYGELDDGVINFGFWDTIEQVQSSYYVNDDGTLAFSETNPANFLAFTPEQRAVARSTIALWDDLVSISFAESTIETADITYGNTNTGGAQAYAYLPFGDTFDAYYSEYFNWSEIGRLSGDIWIDGFVGSNFFPLEDSFYSVLTMIHETGHALGLSHPGDYDALDDNDGDGVPDPITYENDASFAQDSLQYTVMSYFDAYETGAQHIDWSLTNFAYAATPLVHDISSIQAIYGVDTTSRTGNTVYGFNSTADRAAYDFAQNSRPIVAIWDAGGTDTIDFSGWNTPSTIDLNEGGFSSGGGIVEFLTLEQVNANRAALGFAPRSQATFDFYEGLKAQFGLTSGLFTDNVSVAYGAVIENAVGGGGNDLLIANGVANILTGNAGSDTASYQFAKAGVIASLVTGGSTGDAAGDKYVTIENLTGSQFDDVLLGRSGDGADNILEGLGGADVLDGAGGSDTASYANAAQAVAVSLLAGGTAGDAIGDTFVSIENLTGSDFDDTLGGNAGVNIIDGGDGSDTLSYIGAVSAIVVSLATGGSAGLATGDRYIAVENVTGTGFADSISGDAGDNVLTGGLGADTLDGGNGSDTVSYADATSGVTVNLQSNGVTGSTAAKDIISGFENATGGAFADTLAGNGGANVLAGGGGSDTLLGNGGGDTIDGDGGSDTARGGNGNDTLDGGSGNDLLLGETNDDLIFGGAGDDILNGGGNNDSLDGEGGSNSLTGGTGADIFGFSVIDGGKDVITDFRSGLDTINLSQLDAISGTPGLDAFTFIGADAFTAAGQLRTFDDAGIFSLGGDIDGDGIADLVIGLQGITAIAVTDIVYA